MDKITRVQIALGIVPEGATISSGDAHKAFDGIIFTAPCGYTYHNGWWWYDDADDKAQPVFRSENNRRLLQEAYMARVGRKHDN